MGSDLSVYKKQKAVPTVEIFLDDVQALNYAISELKELVKEGCTDLELYKMVIEQDLKYL